jgi:hypothetical protein
VVDVANVMGARPDGWWRDRAGAAARLGREVAELAGRETGTAYVLVLEGQARPAAALIEAHIAETQMIDNVPISVRIVSAAGAGDDTIVDVVAEIIGVLDDGAGDASCLVVTADRELRRRCEALGATAAGPGWLLGRL